MAVISLNTMYFYDSNKGELNLARFLLYPILISCGTAITGCVYKEPDDPGNLQFDWLEVQLDMYRRRGMQVRSFLWITRAITSCATV